MKQSLYLLFLINIKDPFLFLAFTETHKKADHLKAIYQQAKTSKDSHAFLIDLNRTYTDSID